MAKTENRTARGAGEYVTLAVQLSQTEIGMLDKVTNAYLAKANIPGARLGRAAMASMLLKQALAGAK